MRQHSQNDSKKVRHIQLKVPADIYRKFHTACAHEETNMRAKALDLIVEYTEKSTSFFDLDDAEQDRIVAQATSEAAKKVHAAGFSTTHGDDKGIYLLHPDGRKEYIKTYNEEDGSG